MHGLRGLELYLAGCRGIVHTTPQGIAFGLLLWESEAHEADIWETQDKNAPMSFPAPSLSREAPGLLLHLSKCPN